MILSNHTQLSAGAGLGKENTHTIEFDDRSEECEGSRIFAQQGIAVLGQASSQTAELLGTGEEVGRG